MSTRKISLGITGGIGTGKSYFCHMLEEAGIPVFYTDAEAKNIMATDKEIQRKLKALVGAAVYDGAGQLNRSLMSEYLSQGEESAAQVNAIVHPAVERRFVGWRNRQQASVVAVECALLFESGLAGFVDYTVCMVTDMDTRLQRIAARDGRSTEQIRRLMALQMPDEEKQRRADFIILNDTRASLLMQRQLLLNKVDGIFFS
ncbi:MAG: dephospho-CoA kinase [Bacteroidaceae bacterium]|nr:dephospho-CoA kinase [Bacteroidaceae bacterium]